MPYIALPDRRMPYDNDGTVVVTSDSGGYLDGATLYPSGSQVLALNGMAWDTNSTWAPWNASQPFCGTWFFFPEQREITGLMFGAAPQPGYDYAWAAPLVVQGSNDTTNGLDGTWETASLGSAIQTGQLRELDSWRSAIKTVSFTGPKRTLRLQGSAYPAGELTRLIHIYGQKAAGQTPDDIIYLDQATAYAEFTAPLDFGDRPLGTTATHQFKVKNASATKTANTINIQCNDPDFAISTDGVTWVVTINIASLAAGASSAVLYVRNTTPAPGSALGPRFARIVTTVGSWV